MKISNYDEFEYDYSTYWKNRNYEHFAEVIALKKLFLEDNGNFFIDIGGSFGRHLPMYYNKFKNPIIVDYSLNTLLNNKFRILENYPNTKLIAANVYFLPFRESSIDGSAMIRVLHHIEDFDKFYKQLSYVLKDNATHIQEFANKIHIKARIKHLLKRDFKFFDLTPYQQPTALNFEGSNGTETVFLNYHPEFIIKEVSKFGFTLEDKLGVSYFRINFIKRLVPLKLLIWLEGITQKIFGRTSLAPSIFFKLKIKKSKENNNTYNKLEDILVCPKCKSELIFKKDICTCSECKNKYEKVADIWDFRVQ